MSDHAIVPCLWFDRQAEQAAAFYTRLFDAGKITSVSHYPDSLDNPGGNPPGSVLIVEFELAGRRFTALNGGSSVSPNPSISFFVQVGTPDEARRLYTELAKGGQPLMAFDAYPWSPGYGWIQDRFGVSWQVIAGPRAAGSDVIVPCFMFANAQHGKARAAMELYTAIFPNGQINRVEQYGPGEGPSGAVKHGRFMLAGQELVAMDSHVKHAFDFNDGLSFQVMCESQKEVDRYWAALSEGGEKGQCGWLRDRFGVSWQVVPMAIFRWMAGGDPPARDRAFRALQGMGKLDIAALEAAYQGR